MKYTKVFWVLLWLLTGLVDSCLFEWCSGNKTKLKEKILVNKRYNVIKYDKRTDLPTSQNDDKKMKEQTTLMEMTVAKKIFIHDGNTELTADQKQIVYEALYPMVKQFCRHQRSFITQLIAKFLWHFQLPAEQMFTLNREILMFQLSSDDRWLVVHGNQQISLWNVATGHRQWAQHDHFNKCVVSSDDQFIITANVDTTLQIWAFATGVLSKTLTGHKNSVSSCSLSPDNQFLLSISLDYTVRMWSVATGQCTRTLTCAHSYYFQPQFYGNSQRVIIQSVPPFENELQMWEVETNRCVLLTKENGKEVDPEKNRSMMFEHMLHNQTNSYITTCTLSGDNKFLLSGRYDGTVRVWELETGTKIQTFRGHMHPVRSSFFVKGDAWIASMDCRGTLCIWSVRDGHCVHEFQNYNYHRALQHSYWLKHTNTECIIVATTTSPYEVHVLEVESGRKIFTVQNYNAEVSAMSISSDGRYLFYGDNHGTIKCFIFSKHTLGSFEY